MTDTTQWAAGLFEGEGCIRKDKRKKATFELSLGMTDLDVVERFKDYVGDGSIKLMPQAKPHHKPYYRWTLSGKAKVRSLLSKLLPYFGNRRAYVALNALDDIDLYPPIGGCAI